jgi:PAS domain-containing protein
MTPDPHWAHTGQATDTSAIAAVASTRQAIIANDLGGEPGLADLDWARRLGLSAFAAYPMLVEERLVGVIAVLARRPFSPALLLAMSTLANHVALGIEGKRTEDTLRRVNRTLESLLDAAPVAIVVTDHDGKILRWNRAAEGIFGWTEGQVVLGRIVLARRHGKKFTHGLTPPQRLNIYDFMNSRAIFNSA